MRRHGPRCCRRLCGDGLDESPRSGRTQPAKVRNYSPVGASNVLVYFYLGDPAAGEAKIGEATFPAEPAVLSRDGCQFQHGGRADDEELHIYAVVDPNNTISCPNADDQIVNDNYAHKMVEFEPYRVIIPLIVK